MDRALTLLFIAVLGIMVGFLAKANNTPTYYFGFRCGVIASKMNILTDNGTGEYKRLSDKFTDNNCKFDDDINSYIQSM